VTAEDAHAAVDANGGVVNVAAATRRGRATYWPADPVWVHTVIDEAVALDWQEDDPDGLRLHATTPGQRTYRIAAHPSTEP
jgi:hypothetical protein